MKRDSAPLVLHCGESMLPVLRDGDLLETTLPGRPLRVGDVIAFRPGGSDERIVHRISAILPEGMLTRGDSSDSPDPWLLPAAAPVELVTARIRNGSRRAVRGGRAGRLAAARALGRRRLVAALLRTPLAGILETLAGHLFRFLPLPPLRVLTFSSGEAASRKLLLGSTVIGHYDEDRKEWLVRRRYRWLAASRITRSSSVS